MPRYRSALPMLSGETVLTDSGLETDMIFHHGFELPLFAAFPLLDDARGAEALRRYYRRHALVAKAADVGFVFEAPTWRASTGWATQLGYSDASLEDINRRAIEMLLRLREEFDDAEHPMVISGCIGPRGDAYAPDELMAPEEAQRYHSTQIETFADTEADMVAALTITHPGEAVGVVRAAQACGLPVAISFTVETDGRLPDGSSLARAVQAVDDATDGVPAYYGVNCAHPTHLAGALDAGAPWIARLRMIRANASRLSHAELDAAEELDDGDPDELGGQYAVLRRSFPNITVLGGCCGTDLRHVEAIARACL